MNNIPDEFGAELPEFDTYTGDTRAAREMADTWVGERLARKARDERPWWQRSLLRFTSGPELGKTDYEYAREMLPRMPPDRFGGGDGVMYAVRCRGDVSPDGVLVSVLELRPGQHLKAIYATHLLDDQLDELPALTARAVDVAERLAARRLHWSGRHARARLAADAMLS